MSNWSFMLADSSGRSLGEFKAFDRSVSFGVSRTATASCRIGTEDPLWPSVAVGTTTMKVYGNSGICFWGPIISVEEVGQGQGVSCTINAADMTWRLGKRWYAKDPTGVGAVITSSSPSAIAYGILAAANAEGATGVTQGTAGSFGVTFSQTYLYKRTLDAIAELGAFAGSYEWGLSYTDTGGLPTAFLDLPVTFGTDKSKTVFFEYGTASNQNCKGFSMVTSIDTLATDVTVGGSGPVVTAADASARTTYGRHDDVLSFTDISDTGQLSALAAAHVAIRSTPRVVVNLTPFSATAPKFGTTGWLIGDLVTAYAVVQQRTRFSGTARIWGADITITDNGQEEAALSLAAA